MNVGDYVRTKYGISKCIKAIPIRENSFMYEFDKEVYEDVTYLTANELEKYKSSPQIIDLIEVGDYVNGDYVTKEVPKDKRKKQIIIVDSTCVECGDLPFNNDEIETIVTHEQMEAIQYRVEE